MIKEYYDLKTMSDIEICSLQRDSQLEIQRLSQLLQDSNNELLRRINEFKEKEKKILNGQTKISSVFEK